MLTIEKTVLPSPEQWEIIIEGTRNPMNSWHLMDSMTAYDGSFILGENDHRLMTNLANGGAVHAKYRRMIPVFLTIDAPLYWWKEFDTYKVGTVANSCSTMHKIHAKEFDITDFSTEHLCNMYDYEDREGCRGLFLTTMYETIDRLNAAREKFLETKDKIWWWQMIQLLPTSYNQKRTVMLNYEVLVNIYHSRKNHKLDEWHTFCDWIRNLPNSDLIVG
jgi:hypothetical protein